MSESEIESEIKMSPVRTFRESMCVECNDFIRNNGGTCVANPADIVACCQIIDMLEYLD